MARVLERQLRSAELTESVEESADPRVGLGMRLLYAALVWALLREGLGIVLQVTEMSEVFDPGWFYAGMAFALLAAALPLPLLLRCLVAFAASLFVAGELFYGGAYPGFDAASDFWSQLLIDIQLASAGGWSDVGLMSRTFAFLLGWMALAAVILWLVEYSRPLWLALAVMAGLLLANAAAGLPSAPGVIRTLAIGLLFAALHRRSTLGLLHHEQGTDLPQAGSARWLACAMLLAALCAGAGSAAAYQKPAAPEPLDWSRLLEALHGSSASDPSAAQTGFSPDASRLGGPLEPDTSVAFTARVSQPVSWRGVSKSRYTGSGWDSPEPPGYASVPEFAKEESGARLLVQDVELAVPARGALFTGGEAAALQMIEGERGEPYPFARLSRSPLSGDVQVEGAGPLRYRAVTRVPETDPEQLRVSAGSIPADIREAYLALPDSLPDRVRQLAHEVSGQASTAYEKVNAMKDYLASRYTYSLDATAPPNGTDFVDYFLFEEPGRRGYCDYFSSALAVLLRAEGIPTRYVRGFAPGEWSAVQPNSSDTGTMDFKGLSALAIGGQAVSGERRQTESADLPYQVTVRNSDAHSWVEVYYAGIGWVPVDPTPARAGGILPSADAAERTGFPWMHQVQKAFETAKEHVTEFLSALLIEGYLFANRMGEKLDTLAAARTNRMIAGVAFAVGIALLFCYRSIRKRKPHKLEPLPRSFFTNRTDEVRTSRELLHAWKRIHRRYGPQAKTETFREYVHRLGTLPEPPGDALAELLELTEYELYAEGPPRRSAPRRSVRLSRERKASVPRFFRWRQAAGKSPESRL
ncbi:transglutaminase-like domain-containing protein [Gorillibacterium sp. CAU 1737]|uniref:transglutaminase-like domain-containing protein n=1 Tax=Gorillibacterium sp. CAU 1737 TaxID=3140362 RepID=UPI0032610F5B